MIPSYLSDISVWRDTLPGILIVVVFTYLAAKTLCIKNKELTKYYFASILAVALLGMTTGFMMGLSREAAVNAVVPAVLSAIGGMIFYLVGIKKVENQYLVFSSIIGFVISLFFGSIWGAKLRSDREEHIKSYEYRAEILRIDHLINIKKITYEDELRKLHEKYKK